MFWIDKPMEAESRMQLPGAGVVTGTQRLSVWKVVGFGFAENSAGKAFGCHKMCVQVRGRTEL